jgi:hypothetical protein
MAALRAFVENGGGVVFLGRCGLREEDGSARQDFVFGDWLGLKYEGMTKSKYSFVRFDSDHPTGEGLERGFPMSVFDSRQVLVKDLRGDPAPAAVVSDFPAWILGFMPYQSTGHPALVVRTQGRGRVAYCAAPLGAVYSQIGHPDYRRMVRNLAVWSAGKGPDVEVEAPETVEAVAWRDGRRGVTTIHLVNRTGAGLARGEGMLMHEVIPVHGVRVKVRGTLSEGTAVSRPSGKRLNAVRKGGWLEIAVDKIDVWEIIEIGRIEG